MSTARRLPKWSSNIVFILRQLSGIKDWIYVAGEFCFRRITGAYFIIILSFYWVLLTVRVFVHQQPVHVTFLSHHIKADVVIQTCHVHYEMRVVVGC